ncbi:hypothetical protein D082_30760 [Synechocystis sp. PCC 6714]|nr:hypothetical protein D082_30760 [Synechocystis sp. PCC 6714]
MNLLSFAQISDFSRGKGNKFNYFAVVCFRVEEFPPDNVLKVILPPESPP